jgi:hypothetical protein
MTKHRIEGYDDGLLSVTFETTRKPSRAMVRNVTKTCMRAGASEILVSWGENWVEFRNMSGTWHGYGWLRDICGQDLANEFNRR